MNGVCQWCGGTGPLIESPSHNQFRCFKCAGLKPGEPPPTPDAFKAVPDAALIVQFGYADSERLFAQIQKQAAQSKGATPGPIFDSYIEGVKMGIRSMLKLMEAKALALAREREKAT